MVVAHKRETASGWIRSAVTSNGIPLHVNHGRSVSDARDVDISMPTLFACLLVPHNTELQMKFRPSLILGVLLGNAHAANEPYFTLHETELGVRDYRVANGNPMKGLIANPEFWYDPQIDSIDSSMDIYYIPVGNIMRDDPNIVGGESAFDWSYVEDRLRASGEKHRHTVLTFAVHYPGKPLSLPGHLQRSNEVPLQYVC